MLSCKSPGSFRSSGSVGVKQVNDSMQRVVTHYIMTFHPYSGRYRALKHSCDNSFGDVDVIL